MQVQQQTSKAIIPDGTHVFGFITEQVDISKKADRELFALLGSMDGFYTLYKDPHNAANTIWIYETRKQMREAKLAAKHHGVRMSSGAIEFATTENGSKLTFVIWRK